MRWRRRIRRRFTETFLALSEAFRFFSIREDGAINTDWINAVDWRCSQKPQSSSSDVSSPPSHR